MINILRQTQGILRAFPLKNKDLYTFINSTKNIRRRTACPVHSMALAGRSGTKSQRWVCRDLSEDRGPPLGHLAINHPKPFFSPQSPLPWPTEKPEGGCGIRKTAPRRQERRERGKMVVTSRGSLTLELGSSKNSEQTMQPVWKRHSQEQRLSKVPKQEAIPQHWHDIEVRKIPARLNQLGNDQSRSLKSLVQAHYF